MQIRSVLNPSDDNPIAAGLRAPFQGFAAHAQATWGADSSLLDMTALNSAHVIPEVCKHSTTRCGLMHVQVVASKNTCTMQETHELLVILPYLEHRCRRRTCSECGTSAQRAT